MAGVFSLARAGRWFLESGIQNPAGGVARFYRADLQQNKPVSTEITGYAASTLVYLYRVTGLQVYLDRARLCARFLCEDSWSSELGVFPFEYPSPSAASEHLAFFFDSGITVRGLMAVWSETREDRLLDIASAASYGMLRDFQAADGLYPILALPEKKPLERGAHWSRSMACYQAKSALAWREVGLVTGDAELQAAYLAAIEGALSGYRDFLPGTGERAGVMDRLHAYGYFLEALWPLLDRADCREAYRFATEGIASYLREIAPEFVRSDVYAQLLRARLLGKQALPFEAASALHEAQSLAGFQIVSDDPRLDGGFYFGRREGRLVPHANPVSTAFAVQALHLWGAHQAGEENPCGMPPI